jgi:hypothetical protein
MLTGHQRTMLIIGNRILNGVRIVLLHPAWIKARMWRRVDIAIPLPKNLHLSDYPHSPAVERHVALLVL